MKILVVGSGAREHAIGEKLRENSNVSEIFFAPGNAGTKSIGENIDIKEEEIFKLLEFAKLNNIDFTVVGPEVPLSLGIVDVFEKENLKIFGPNQKSAKLESSKSYAKEFMIRNNIPTSEYIETEDFEKAYEFATKLIKTKGTAVIKADGLCSGKGVFILNKEKEVEKYLKSILIDGEYGEKKVIIEEFLEGFEMSLIAFVDNHSIKLLPTSKDHKNIYNGDLGPNTGGMGTYSPNYQGEVYLDDIKKQVLFPFFNGVKRDNLDFRGVIFIGLMITSEGIKVLEFNTRFGDPETQSILNRIDNDLLDLMIKTSENRLESERIVENDKKVITLVLASGGYPEKYETGFEITGLEKLENVKVYHSGTKSENGKIYTSGGRLLSIVAIEDSFEKAKDKVYSEANKIMFENKYSRNDIGSEVCRYYVEEKENFKEEANELRKEIKKDLEFDPGNIRLFDRFDIEGIKDKEKSHIEEKILYDQKSQILYKEKESYELERDLKNPLVVNFQKGQFNEKEYSTLKNIEIIAKREGIRVNTSKIYSFENELSQEQIDKLEDYIINNTNQIKGKLLGVPTTLNNDEKENDTNLVFEGFINLDENSLKEFLNDKGLAMSFEDLKFIQDYFKDLSRDINETELYILDTYWSDHCRHTTFNTILDVEIKNPTTEIDKKIQEEFNEYLNMKESIKKEKPVSLMDLGTIVSKYLKNTGDLDNVEKSDEVNACSIEIEIKVEDRLTKEIKTEEYLLMFKNETHNHPTEIEPYGGAHTCIGGGIRDPLSGRAYVYQAMRITGSANPLEEYKDTLKGKLSQKRINKEAATGYSTYGNEIGLAGGLVEEIYHPGFKAKRMELGALVGAQKKEYVTRKSAENGDVILLLGAKTGRDGIGAATGSSTEQKEGIIEGFSSEVQRGNPHLERNIIRLFRRPEAIKLIKKSNDFGAGGVSVAIGELADSLDIYLDRVPLKYPGLSPKEIAIAESQERMAVVIDSIDKDEFIKYCQEEDIETTLVADVTDTNKMIMYYKDKVVCELDREFLNSSGVDRFQKVLVENNHKSDYFENKGNNIEELYKNLDDINYVSKKNLYSKFDYTIGRSTILAPLGGKNQITPIQTMSAIIPSMEGNSKTASLMSYGYNPFLSEENQFLGGYYAVVESLTKLAASGGNPFKSRLSFQEYFESLGDNEIKWSKPLKSLLGAFYACRELKVAPIGGKDSMSGTYKDINVPPSLFSFGVVSEDVENIISPELKGNLKLGIVENKLLDDKTLDHNLLKDNLEKLYEEIKNKNVVSAHSLNYKGMLHNLMEMSLGNNIGFDVEFDRPFDILLGSIIVEYKDDKDFITPIGESKGDVRKINSVEIDLGKFTEKYFNSLDEIYTPVKIEKECEIESENKEYKSTNKNEDIKALIPIFPGTTGEYDIEELLLEQNITCDKYIFRMNTVEDLKESIKTLSEKINESNILILASGMITGDEPSGSGKYVSTILMEENVKKSIEALIDRDGLILGIGSGFNALLRTGLLSYGEYKKSENSPLFIKNKHNSHICKVVEMKYLNNNSPWLQDVSLDKIYYAPVSTLYGRMLINDEEFNRLKSNGQIACMFTEDVFGSDKCIESIISPCGKIIGKLSNFERIKENTLINLEKLELQNLITSAGKYFSK